jgi:hypothetical protein
MDQLLEHQLSSLSSSPSSSSSLLISFQFLSFFYDEYDVTDTKKDQKASLETLFSSQLQKCLSLSNNTILSSSSSFSATAATSATSSELHYSILLLLSTSVKLGGILHGISSLYSSSYSSLYQLVVVYFFLLPPPSIPSLSSSSISSSDISKKECFLLSHSILRELLIQQEYPIKPTNQQLQYQIISFLCSESERFLSLQQEEIHHSSRKILSSSVNVFLNELLQTMILIATNTLYWSCRYDHVKVVEFLLKEVKEMAVNKVNDKYVRSLRSCHYAYDCYYLEINTLFDSFYVCCFRFP